MRENYKPIFFTKKNAIVAELGVALGSHSLQIYNNCKPNKLFLIDSWTPLNKNYRIPEKYYKNQETCDKEYNIVYTKVKNLNNINIIRKTTTEAAADFEDEYFDWIYIDAGHWYENVMDDLNNWYPKVKKDGIICGHDWDKKMSSGKLEV